MTLYTHAKGSQSSLKSLDLKILHSRLLYRQSPSLLSGPTQGETLSPGSASKRPSGVARQSVLPHSPPAAGLIGNG